MASWVRSFSGEKAFLSNMCGIPIVFDESNDQKEAIEEENHLNNEEIR